MDKMKPCETCGSGFVGRPGRRFCRRKCIRFPERKLTRKTEVWFDDAAGYTVGRVLEGEQWRRVKQHRFVMEQHLGRRLESWEDVHHLDGNKKNNDISNLQVLSHAEHTRLTNAERVPRRGHKLQLSNEERRRRSVARAEMNRRGRALLGEAVRDG